MHTETLTGIKLAHPIWPTGRCRESVAVCPANANGRSSLGNPKDFACSGGHLVGPLFASVSRGWLALSLGAGGVNVGPGGLLTTEDGGKTWRCTNMPPNTNLVSAADPLHVWVTSEMRGADNPTGLFASDDGGRTWHPLDLSDLR